MSDIAQILLAASTSTSKDQGNDAVAFKKREIGKSHNESDKPTKKKKKMSRELSGLLGHDNVVDIAPPIVPTRKLAGLKGVRKARGSQRWLWSPFSNSARKDGVQFYHWTRADADYIDYPFSRFNRKAEIVKYTDKEYQQMQNIKNTADSSWSDLDKTWTKEITDSLFELIRKYDLRWPIVFDRFCDIYPKQKSVEELKLRYYSIIVRLIALRNSDDPKNPNKKESSYLYPMEQEQKYRQVSSIHFFISFL